MIPDRFETARLLLRPLAADDAPAIFDGYAQDAEATRYLTWRPHRSVADSHAYVRSRLSANTSRTFAVVDAATGRLIGAFDLRGPAFGRLEFGCVLARAHWGHGLMTEVVTEVAGWALRQQTVWRIGALADVDNAGSIRVLEKAGFDREGVLRRWLVHPNLGDAPRDCVSFARVR